MASAWGSAWGLAWGNSWGTVAAADTGDGATDAEIRALERAARSAREAHDESRRERRRKEQRLANLIDRAYRKVVLNEPEAAAEIAAAVSAEPAVAITAAPLSSAELRAAIVGDVNLMQSVADRLRDWLVQQHQARDGAEMERLAAEMADEDDVETLLLLIN